MFRFIFTMSVALALVPAGTVFAQQAMQVTTTTQGSGTISEPNKPAPQSTSPVSTQLTVITDLESKIVEKIPEPIKTAIANFDHMRAELAVKYAALRDSSVQEEPIKIKGDAIDTPITVEYSPNIGYYYYSALALFFSYPYVFYGIVLLAAFFVLRIILRYFNIIV